MQPPSQDFLNYLLKPTKDDISVKNLASSYTEYVTVFNFWTAEPECGYKDVYNTSNSVAYSNYNQYFAYVDSHRGPTPMEREEKVTSGTTRSSSFSAQIPVDIVKFTLGCEYSSSYATEVKKKFTFPGDNILHTLYVTRNHIDKNGYSSRTSYISYPVSYTYIKFIASWDIVWGPFNRYSSRDVASHNSCAITEYQYGTYMN